jgi:uncharacterized glyoxalase superfamily protein PhnB
MAETPTACTFCPCLFYRDAPAMIDWLERAFGFRRRLVVPGAQGRVDHAELSFGAGVVMVSSVRSERGWMSPRDLAALNQIQSVTVDDPDAHFARAQAAGAEILQPLKDEEYGSRGYLARDPEGNEWYFGTYRPGGHWTS